MYKIISTAAVLVILYMPPPFATSSNKIIISVLKDISTWNP